MSLLPKKEKAFDIEKLIDLVKNNPSIYDYALAEHKNKECSDYLWQKISDEMNAPTLVCKNKWLALRNSYAREVRNENNKRKRKKWYLTEKMEFLRKYLCYGQSKKHPISDDQFVTYDDYTNMNNDEKSSSLPMTEIFESKYVIPKEDKNQVNCEPSSSSTSQTTTVPETIPQPSPAPVQENITKSTRDQLWESHSYATTSRQKTIPQPPAPVQENIRRSTGDQFWESHCYATSSPQETISQPSTPVQEDIKNPIGDSFREPNSNVTTSRQEAVNEVQEQNMAFFKSILPDILKLSERRQRLFRQDVIYVLNNSLDEQELTS